MNSKVIDCDCQHEFQDKEYGKGKRIANKLTKHPGYRCTVCGKDRMNIAKKK